MRRCLFSPSNQRIKLDVIRPYSSWVSTPDLLQVGIAASYLFQSPISPSRGVLRIVTKNPGFFCGFVQKTGSYLVRRPQLDAPPLKMRIELKLRNIPRSSFQGITAKASSFHLS